MGGGVGESNIVRRILYAHGDSMPCLPVKRTMLYSSQSRRTAFSVPSLWSV